MIETIHMWDYQGNELEPIKRNIKYAYYLRCDNEYARTTISNWLKDEGDDVPNWEAGSNEVWKDVGEDEAIWENLKALKEKAMLEYDTISAEIRKFSTNL